MLNYVLRHEDACESGGIAPHIHNLGSGEWSPWSRGRFTPGENFPVPIWYEAGRAQYPI
jgi:hypothetical protein